MRPCQRGQEGTTLVELMVVVGIIGALLAIGFSQLNIDSYRLNADARTIIGAVQYAKMEAVKRNTANTRHVSVNIFFNENSLSRTHIT